MKKVKIIRGNYWYKGMEGRTFNLIKDVGKDYVVSNVDDVQFYVSKEDSMLSDSEILTVSVRPKDDSFIDIAKLPQGDWIDIRAVEIYLIRLNNTVTENENGEYVLTRSNEKTKCYWSKGNFEGKEVEFIPYEKGEVLLVDFGFAMKLPENFESYILPRSSFFKSTGLILSNSQGVIDNAYNGDNDTWKAMFVALKSGFILRDERICQFRIHENQSYFDIVKVQSLNNSDRGGFGEGTKNEK